ncbi:DUF1801 domain-containing protein [Lewinella cohaerens]|uniref:DUF1801 domain-containing protein n=1 Tax=Lewinella cohaerens TaxID=70995 RepID=UPI000378BCE9|nr:DUF1801 domain-containing protein [Lewinella cohaerens]
MNSKVDDFLGKAKKWRPEMEELRRIILDCQLSEEWKWRAPCYTFQESNIVILGALKDCCTLGFFKGALLKDPNNILAKPGENTQSARVVRFTSVREILELEPVLKAYIYEAAEVEEAGLKVEYKSVDAFAVPEELQSSFDENPALKTAFEALTPGRQKGYLLYFSAPKQSKTKKARIEKYTQRILDGKGFHDCVCGLSKKMPNCDGSHKHIV